MLDELFPFLREERIKTSVSIATLLDRLRESGKTHLIKDIEEALCSLGGYSIRSGCPV